MAGGRPVVGLAPAAGGTQGRPVVGLAPSKGPTGRTVVGLAGAQAAPKKSGGGFLGALKKYSGAELVGNAAKDVGSYAVGVGPGLYHALKTTEQQTVSRITGNKAAQAKADQAAVDIAKSVGHQYKDYYGHDVGHHLYQHPLQALLDAATVASAGAGAVAKGGSLAAKAGVIADTSRLAKLGERATIATRSPRRIATGKGPVHTDITSAKPLVKLREQAGARGREARTRLAQTSKNERVQSIAQRGGELKAYGKQIQAEATQKALGRVQPYEKYFQATHRLSHNEWSALHIRATDIHPNDLKILWKGTPLEKVANDAKVQRLALIPSKRMLRAEPKMRDLSQEGGALYKQKRMLKEDTANARADLTKRQASKLLGRPVKEIHGDPYYFPHTMAPEKGASPLTASGGGRGVPKRPGDTRENLGTLFFHGKLHMRSDVLGPNFLARVKHIKYDEVHNALTRGAVRLSYEDIQRLPNGRLPKGWGYVPQKPTVIKRTVSAEPNPDQLLIPGTQGATKTESVRLGQRSVPATIRGEGDTHVPMDQMLQKAIPNAEDLHDSILAKTGFFTEDQAAAHTSGGKFYAIPKSTAKAATGEFTRSSDFVHTWVKKPLSVWRAVVLGLRVGFLTNNLVGNSIMYGVKTGGNGALRDLFGAIVESHGRDVARKVLDDPATPPQLRSDLYKEFFPEQIQGTFGKTQSPATSQAHIVGRKSLEAGRAVTGALPKLTSKIAEEYPRRALIRNTIRHSPEFKRVYSQMPRQTRTFEDAARKVLEGKGGKQYQRWVSKQVNYALGDYHNMSPFERNVMRNALPFYSWYRAITTTTYHLAADTPGRAEALAMIGRIGEQHDNAMVPSFLRGFIPFGPGKGGTVKGLATQGMNPYSTLEQLRSGLTEDVGNLGVNPFLIAAAAAYAKATQHGGRASPADIAGTSLLAMLRGLPPSRLIAPMPPSQLYPNRNRKSELLSFLGAPVKEYNPSVAAQQKAQGR